MLASNLVPAFPLDDRVQSELSDQVIDRVQYRPPDQIGKADWNTPGYSAQNLELLLDVPVVDDIPETINELKPGLSFPDTTAYHKPTNSQLEHKQIMMTLLPVHEERTVEQHVVLVEHAEPHEALPRPSFRPRMSETLKPTRRCP